MDGIGDCEEFAPPDSFAPSLQWSFGANEQSMVTPLAGNFTDDNGDGEIDLCDVPDVLLVSGPTITYGAVCPIHMLDGATGTEHFQIPPSENVACFATPAFGDRQRRPARDRRRVQERRHLPYQGLRARRRAQVGQYDRRRRGVAV